MANIWPNAVARMLFASAAAAFALTAMPNSAAADSWGTLTVYEGSTAQGQGYGTWDAVGSLSDADGYLKDLKPTGESIYFSVQTLTSSCNWACAGRSTSVEYTESARWNGNYWRLWGADTTISPKLTYDAANIKVCEDQRISPDACSSNAHVGDF